MYVNVLGSLCECNDCDESTLLSQIIVLQCTGRPPSSKKVLNDCINKYSPTNEHTIQTLPNTEEDPIDNKEFKLRVRRKSGSGSDTSGCTISQYSKTSQESDISNKKEKMESEDLFDTTSCSTPDRNLKTTDIESPSKEKCDSMTTHSPSGSQGFVQYDQKSSYNRGSRLLKANDMDFQDSLLSVHDIAKTNVGQCKDKGIILSEHSQEGEKPDCKFEKLFPFTRSFSDSPNISVQNLKNVKSKTTGINENLQYITVMSMECYVETRQKLLPDPEFDAVLAVFYSIENDQSGTKPMARDEHKHSKKDTIGVIIVDSWSQCTTDYSNMLSKAGVSYVNNISVVETEECMYAAFIEIVHLHDPDFLVGYDTETCSYGYLVRRAAVKGNTSLI